MGFATNGMNITSSPVARRTIGSSSNHLSIVSSAVCICTYHGARSPLSASARRKFCSSCTTRRTSARLSDSLIGSARKAAAAAVRVCIAAARAVVAAGCGSSSESKSASSENTESSMYRANIDARANRRWSIGGRDTNSGGCNRVGDGAVISGTGSLRGGFPTAIGRIIGKIGGGRGSRRGILIGAPRSGLRRGISCGGSVPSSGIGCRPGTCRACSSNSATRTLTLASIFSIFAIISGEAPPFLRLCKIRVNASSRARAFSSSSSPDDEAMLSVDSQCTAYFYTCAH